MKKLLTFTNIIGAIAMGGMLTGCGTTSTSNSTAIATSQKEMLLSQAGFIPKTVTTPKQQQQAAKLSAGAVSAVKYKGKLFYAYPTGKNRILIGKQTQFDAYKKLLQAQMTKPQQNSDGAYLTGETAGPNRIVVEEFDGFGPIQDNPAWQ